MLLVLIRELVVLKSWFKKLISHATKIARFFMVNVFFVRPAILDKIPGPGCSKAD